MRDASVSGSPAFAFDRDGFVGPFQLFTADDCRVIACHFKQAQQQPPANWFKGLALNGSLRPQSRQPTSLALAARRADRRKYRALGLNFGCPGTGGGSSLAHRHRIFQLQTVVLPRSGSDWKIPAVNWPFSSSHDRTPSAKRYSKSCVSVKFAAAWPPTTW